MKNNDNIKVVIADNSAIIRAGITTVLKRLPNYTFSTNEISNLETLQMFLRLHTPEILLINPLILSNNTISAIKKEFPKIKTVAILSSFIDSKTLTDFDDTISIFDETDSIITKMDGLLTKNEEESTDTEQLSYREKEIIACIVKGMTNKAIADKLSISIHTVITHRRNITKKLQIHSAAGLAIYAIVNKIVEIQDIKGGIN
ncbi:MAG: response regulator transcription factor [Bacteroidetes bacterium]|uniref:Response regulator transcription factor n=1 Tax=Candidatus Limisoma faecipullorum TaxID=2840854 RepID=A0A9D9IM90_9BACT|nr:response regulator transcription factor [Candidatus Limisoma faecipullorum]